jgi:hypothetical protein
MRFMVIVKATPASEAGALPAEKLLADMSKFNEELEEAGVLRAAKGLHPSSKGARITFSGENRAVLRGPFADARQLVAGFWLWECGSLEEAIDWAKRCPDPMPGEESQIEIRQIFESEDFGDQFTQELREKEGRLRARINERKARRVAASAGCTGVGG